MIVVSASMRKGGSGWFFNVTHDLVLAATGVNTRKMRNLFPGLAEIILPPNCLVKQLSGEHLGRLDVLHEDGKTIVVKTHSSPSSELRARLEAGAAKGAYLYRDPRDVALSAFDHAESIRADPGRFVNKGPYEFLDSLEDAIVFASKQLRTWRAWTDLDCVLVARYEDFVSDDEAMATRIAEFLDLGLPRRKILKIVKRYRPEKLNDLRSRRLHFNVGTPRRFEKTMNRRQLDLCNELFGKHLPAMGYEVL
ncbi:MAG: sulfotransferase domain-containing protein [Thermoanaerobaculia bacterium]|nr:sulfotransferase domain-containing protein [Thermoanaerobaculia bacterium]